MLLVCVYEYYFIVLFCDVEIGFNDEEEIKENIYEDEENECL